MKREGDRTKPPPALRIAAKSIVAKINHKNQHTTSRCRCRHYSGKQMKALTYLMAEMIFSGCAAPSNILIPKDKYFTVESEGKHLFYFRSPTNGVWYFSPGGMEQIKGGFTNLKGSIPTSPLAYSIKLSMAPLADKKNTLTDVLQVLRANDLNPFLQKNLAKYTPERLNETK